MNRVPRIAWLLAAVLALGFLFFWMAQVDHHSAGLEPVGSEFDSQVVPSTMAQTSSGNAPRLQQEVQAQAANATRPAGHTVIGRVIDEVTRQPVPNATVSFRYVGSRRPAREAVQTGVDGFFKLEDLPSERIIIQVAAKDYSPAEHGAQPPVRTPLDIPLGRGGVIAGQLLSADGVGVPGTIEVWNITASSGEPTASLADGQFRLPNLKPGRYRVSGQTRAGFTTPVDVLLDPNQRVEGLVLRVVPGREIRGTISGLPPKELQQVRVNANAIESGRDVTVEVASSGFFRIEGVQPGRVQVVANSPAGRSVSKLIEVTATADATVDLRFSDGVRLTGRVTRRGQPVAGALVIATHIDDTELSASARTSNTGHYAIDGLVAGEEHEVSVNHRIAGNIRVFDGWVFDIELRDTSVSGRILRVDGEPLPGAYVIIRHSHGSTGMRSDERGEFSVPVLEPGEIEVIAYKPGFAWVRQPLQLGDASPGLTLRLRESPGVEVRARDAANGVPLPDLLVLAVTPGRDDHVQFRVELDEHGIGSLPSEISGHRLAFFASEYAVIMLDSWNGEPLDLVFDMQPQPAPQ